MRIKTTGDIIVTDNLIDSVVIWTKDENTITLIDAKDMENDEYKFDETVYINLQEVLAFKYTRKEAKEVKNNG